MASSSTTANAGTDTSNSIPTSKFLQSRIETLRNSLISRLENIFATSMDDIPSSSTADDTNEDQQQTTSDSTPAPPLTETATRQLTLTIETTALIRAAEEILVLTRCMKELWLFGGLRTIAEDTAEEREEKDELRKKESEVVKGMLEFLSRADLTGEGSGSVKEDDEDVVMKVEDA